MPFVRAIFTNLASCVMPRRCSGLRLASSDLSANKPRDACVSVRSPPSVPCAKSTGTRSARLGGVHTQHEHRCVLALHGTDDREEDRVLQHICEISNVKGVAIVHEPGGLTAQRPASPFPASSLAPEAGTRQAMLMLCLRCSTSSPHAVMGRMAGTAFFPDRCSRHAFH